MCHYFKNAHQGSRVKDIERKRNGDEDQACVVGGGNGAGEKESRVSRVTIRFGTAVVSVGSWALSICNSLYGVRDVCTWLYCIGHGNATRTISNYTMVDGKRNAGRGRVVARVVETLTRSTPRCPFSRGGGSSPLKIQAPRPMVIRQRTIFRGSRRMEFSSNIMPHKLTGSIFRLFMHRTTIIASTSKEHLPMKGVSEK